MQILTFRRSTFAWTCFISSILFWIVIFKLLFYRMDVMDLMKFSTFERISIPLSLVPIAIGIYSLTRRERKWFVSLSGMTISLLTCAWLVVMIAIDGV